MATTKVDFIYSHCGIAKLILDTFMEPVKSIILILIGINIGIGLMCLTKFREEFFRMLKESSYDKTGSRDS